MIFVAAEVLTCPPQIPDPAFIYDESRHKALLDDYLKALTWEHNLYLRSPDAMFEAGFKGTPYQLA